MLAARRHDFSIKRYVYVNSCVSYPACKAHAPFYVIYGLSGSTFYFRIISNSTILGGGGLLNIKCVLILSTTVV